MAMKYEEFHKVKLKDLSVFFSGNVMNILKKDGWSTLKDLFEMYDRKYLSDDITKYVEAPEFSSVYIEIYSNIKLLRYIYLGINPEFDYDARLVDLGLTPHLSNRIIRFGASKFGKQMLEVDILKIIVEDRSMYQSFLMFRGVGRQAEKELMVKAKHIIRYFEEKSKNETEDLNVEVTDDELLDLYKELSELLKKSKLLNEQIEIVQNKIQKRIGLRDECEKTR